MATYKDKSMTRLLNFFGIAINKTSNKFNSDNRQSGVMAPGTHPKNSKGVTDYSKIVPIDFPTDIKNAYNYFMSNYSLYNSNAERMNRYKELQFAIRNDGIMGAACLIYTEETYEVKDGQKPIQIKSKEKKVDKIFYNWLDSIGFNTNILRELAWNLTLYGDGFWINAIDLEKGIIGITPLDPFLVRDKIEFNLNAVNNIKEWETSSRNLTNKYKALQQISDLITNEGISDDYSLYYQSYLLGYELKFSSESENYKAVPPWAITHFRHFSTSSEFFPFGRPIFINSLARFKSYRTTEMLIDMLRVASFPKEHIKILGGETLTPMDRIQRVNEVREMIENITPVTNTKDNLAIGERMFSVEGLFDYEILDSSVDIDSLGDLEMKKDDLILSTGIPDSYLIPSRGAGMGGENASALYYNNKIFQRRVEGNKNAILEGLAFSFRLHLELTEQFDGEKTEFELFMPVNAEMYAADKVRNDSDMLRLATDMMNNLGQALGMDRGESLPEPVVRDIFKQYLPIDDDLIDKWINKIVKKAEENDEENADKPTDSAAVAAPMIMTTDSAAAVGSTPAPKTAPKGKPSTSKKKESVIGKFLEGYYKGKEDPLIREAYFKAKKDSGLTNGMIGKYLYYNDSYLLNEATNKPGYKYSTFSILRKYKNDVNRKLIEDGKKKE